MVPWSGGIVSGRSNIAMCGIVGVIHLDRVGIQPRLLERMAGMLRHRGPDDAGVFVHGHVGLGHRRLKIIDLSAAAHQPISNEDGTVWVTYNGEIYNFAELRDELLRHGHTFASRSDSEVIVHAYEEWGERCVDRFNGMFAYALWDGREERLLLVRDRLGVKPLFYYLDEDKLLFASEIKAILQYPQVDTALDSSAVYDYFSLNYVPAPKTPFARVRVVPPGHWLAVHGRRMKLVRYWDIAFANGQQVGRGEEYIEQILVLLQDAVRRRLVADVPLGAFLSGGIDSSAIVFFMQRLGHPSLKTFNVRFHERSYDEGPYARLAARHTGTEHHEIACTAEDLRSLLETIAWHADNLTADISMLPMFLLAKLARQHVTVVLSGDGGDELFGGYLTYRADVLGRYYRQLPAWVRTGLLRPLVAALPASTRKQSFDYKLGKFIEGAGLPPIEGHYVWRTIFSDHEKGHLLSREFLETVQESDTAACYRRHFANARAASVMDKIFYADFKVFLADSILAKVDSMTMAHSLEAREPLLDYRLVELAATIPHGLKIRGLETKHIFKQAMRQFLPRSIVFQAKKGFHSPLAKWFREELRSFVDDILSPGNLRALGMFNVPLVDTLKRRHFHGQENNAFKLWSLMNFLAWHYQVARSGVGATFDRVSPLA